MRAGLVHSLPNRAAPYAVRRPAPGGWRTFSPAGRFRFCFRLACGPP